MFSDGFRDIDHLLARFQTEQDSKLDQFILLQRINDFKKVHTPIENTIMESLIELNRSA